MKWTINTVVQPYRRADVRLAYPFRWAGNGGEIALTAQSVNGTHGEFDAKSEPTDRLVERRQWLSMRLDF
ncbi:MAG: TonB-dependent receptor, partial [Rhodocyclaceae bacterium]|nr:TonB-dependent receptor [Rhodocyclaceae bacterium]